MIDKLLSAKVDDAIRLSQKGPKFIGFLDCGESAEIKEYLSNRDFGSIGYFGGYPDAERVVMGIFPDYLEPEESLFPISSLTITYKRDYELKHKDFLGTFMAQGIARSTIGDILIEPGRCVIFVKEELADYFLSSLTKIGGVGISVSYTEGDTLPPAHTYQEISGIISSPRLDCIVSMLTNLSRDKTAKLINTGLVACNYKETDNVSMAVKEGSVISIRSYGKYIIDTIGPNTKKGRLIIKCRKYK